MAQRFCRIVLDNIRSLRIRCTPMGRAREAELMEIIRLKDEENARLRAHIALLEQKIDFLVRRIFGCEEREARCGATRTAAEPGG